MPQDASSHARGPTGGNGLLPLANRSMRDAAMLQQLSQSQRPDCTAATLRHRNQGVILNTTPQPFMALKAQLKSPPCPVVP